MVILRVGGDDKGAEEVRKTLEFISKNLAVVLKGGETEKRNGRKN